MEIESYLTTDFLARGLRLLPLIAAKPPTKPPTKAVTKINKMDEPPKGNIAAILCERTPLFFTSIQKARRPQNKKMPRKPDTNARP